MRAFALALLIPAAILTAGGVASADCHEGFCAAPTGSSAPIVHHMPGRFPAPGRVLEVLPFGPHH